MSEIKLDELKKIQLDILVFIDDFCEKNNINYWIDCGTLLGAVRHKGYIPWDDDIDIGMLREDYDKFMKIFNNCCNNSKYKFISYETDKNWPFPFGKVLDITTILYEPDKKHGMESSVYVDVFPYDNAPDDKKEIYNMFKKRDLYTKLMKLQRFSSFYVEKKNKYNFIRYPFHILMQVFPDDFFVRKSIKLSKKCISEKTKYVGNFTSFSKQYCNKSVFSSFIKLEFEGKKFNAPIGYDEWLKSFYGDYMKLPPVEKQISHHRYEAYHKKGENYDK